MPKTYILTFHGAVNYGAALQAYAFYRKYTDLGGGECEFIDYNRERHRAGWLKPGYYSAMSFRGKLYTLLKYPERKRVLNRFERFTREYMRLTPESYNGRGALYGAGFGDDDIYITGSDQVWNPDVTDNDFHYYLDFTDSPNKYAYAPSFAVTDISGWDKDKLDRVKKLLSDYRLISVREESGQAILRRCLGRDVPVVCDPTMLLTGDEWRRLAVSPRVSGGYAVIFTFTSDDKLIAAARQTAEKRGLKLLNLVYNVSRIPGAKDIKGLGPREWLGYIAGAEHIFTNSFHGFILALNLGRQLSFSIADPARGSRLLDTAERLGVSDRLITDGLPDTKIDYTRVNRLIDADRARSTAFLKEIIDAANENKTIY